MKNILLVLFLALPLFAAETYTYDYEVTLSGAAGKMTLQQPASPTKTARLRVASIYADTAAVVTLERSCTSAATTTVQTPQRYLDGTTVATLRIYTASNASTCTAMKKINVGAGQEVALDNIDDFIIQKNAGANFGFSIASMTGTVRIYLKYTED